MNKMIKHFYVLIVLMVCLFSFIACGSDKPEGTNYDGKEFDLSLTKDDKVVAKTKKIDNGYQLTISGSGDTKDFSSKQNVPWNAIVKKITEIVIEEGVESLGDYFFNSTTVDSFYLPSSVKKVMENTFNETGIVYSYSSEEIDAKCSNKVYYYSENKPEVENVYWHKIGEVEVIWKKYKIFFIGNSFTYYPNDQFNIDNPAVCSLFKELANSMNIDVEVDFVVKGAYKLSQFANPNDEYGKKVDEKLKACDDYEYVILQEQSVTPVNEYNSFSQAVSSLSQKINKTQKDAKIILYATWGYPSAVSANTIFSSVSEMEKLLTEAYEKCAMEVNAKVNYVGKAFTEVYENHKDINIYGNDNKHQNYAGAYLSACVHLSSIFGVDVRNVEFTGNLEKNVAKTLQEIAYKISIK